MNSNMPVSSPQRILNPASNELVTYLNQLLEGKSESEIRRVIRFIDHTTDTSTIPRTDGKKASNNLSTRHSDALSLREKEVLRLVASGGSRKTIALQLGISANTVAKHITNIYQKLRISTIAEATRIAIADKLL